MSLRKKNKSIHEIWDITYEVDCEWMIQWDSELSFKDAIANIIRTVNGERNDLLNDERNPHLLDLKVVDNHGKFVRNDLHKARKLLKTLYRGKLNKHGKKRIGGNNEVVNHQ
jgi:hypothetical protein